MNCKFCMSEEEDLDRNFVLKKLEELRNCTVVFTGGEPLLYDVNDYLKAAKKSGLKTKVQTNGTLIRELNLELVDVVNLPIDGRKSVHDRLRGKGHFSAVMKAAKFVRGSCRLSVTTVVTKENVSEVKPVGEIVTSLKAESWKLFKFKPKGRGKNHPELSISDREFEKAVKIAKSFNLKVYAVKDPDRMNAVVFRRLKQK